MQPPDPHRPPDAIAAPHAAPAGDFALPSQNALQRGLSAYGLPARHRWEIPLLIAVVAVTACAYLVAFGMISVGYTDQYVLLIILAPVVVWFVRGRGWAAPRVGGIKMSPTQFPQAYQLVVDAAARFGMSKVPDAYVVLGNGQVNAMASGHGFRRYVVVYSDLFEVGGESREPDALAFIIGHEVGHIAAGHTSYWRQLGTFAMGFLPFLGAGLSRAQEYTADNHGYAFRPNGASGAMRTLGAGKYLNAAVHFDELADRAAHEPGIFPWLANALASHPVLTWRSNALRDRRKHGRLLFAPPGSAKLEQIPEPGSTHRP